jgi:PA domain-containing protein/type IX secretion system substrate protein
MAKVFPLKSIYITLLKFLIMKISTLIRSFSLLALLSAFAFNLSAQRAYTFNIDSPVYPDTYTAVPAGFGSADYCGGVVVTGDLVFVTDGTAPVNDGCEAPVNDVTGKIVVIDRGDCEFGAKALNAEQAGAIAVIVVNNVPDPPFSMSPGAVGAQVTIPVFMLSQEDGSDFRDDLLFGIIFPATLEPDYPEIPAGTNILWGANPGEGDFDGSLNNWTIENVTCGDGTMGFDGWRWAEEGDISAQGAYVGGGGLIASPSACNGAAYFDSDFYDNGGDPNNAGGGDCPAAQSGQLISPVIDISGINVSGASLMFYQALREYQSDYFVGWSTDNGSTWTEVQINPDEEVPLNSGHINELVKIPMLGVVGSSTLQVRFRYEANYYYWMIDDVMIIEQEANDMQVNSNFFAIPQNAVFPAGQVDPINFLVDIENVGAEPQNGVKVNISVVNDATSDEVYSSELDYGTIPGNTISENGIIPGQFNPDIPAGTYTGTYTVSQDETDADLSNNSLSFQFVVSDTVFAKETGGTRDIAPATGNWDATEEYNWAYGNCFFIDDGMDAVATSISFGIGNAPQVAGKNFYTSLYYWLDDGDGNSQVDERILIGREFYQIEGTETDDDIITVPFGDETPILPSLAEEGYYIAMIEYVDGSDQTNFFLRGSEARNYSAMAYLTDSIQMPRHAAMLAIDETLDDEDFSSSGFGLDLVPVVRMNISPLVPVNEPLSDDNIIEVFPNPANNFVNVRFELTRIHEHVLVQLIDYAGRLAVEATYDNIANQTISLNTSQFPAGAYSLRIMTEDGVRTEKLIIAE